MKARVLFSYLLIVAGLVGLVTTIVLRFRSVDVGGDALDSLPALVGLILAVLLVRRVPDNRIGLVLSLIAFTAAILNLADPLVRIALDGGEPVYAILGTQLANAVFPTLIVSLLILLPLWFPTGRAIGQRWEWVWKLAVVAALLVYGAGWLVERTCVSSPDGFGCARYVATPWGIPGWNDEVISPVFMVVFALVVPAIASLVIRFRRARAAEREQLRLFAFFIAVAGIAFLGNVVLGGILDVGAPWFQGIFNLALTASLISIAVAVLKYRLYEIDRIISRTITYSIVVALLAGVVALVATVVGTRFESPLVVAGTTLGVAAVFNPLRRRVQTWVDRRFNRSRYDAERVMDRFATSLRDELDSDEVVGGWVEAVSATMQPSALGVWVKP